MGELTVLVVGAGIAGLTCAISLAQHKGLKVTILEKATSNFWIGNGIQIPCNAAHVMKKLGLLGKLLAAGGGPAQEWQTRNYSTGQVLLRKDLSRCEELYGAPWLLIHRGDYIHILQEEALRLGVRIITDCDVQDINFETPSVKVAGGETHKANVIIGCDGIHSTVRAAMHPTLEPYPTGEVAYRCILTSPQFGSASNAVLEFLSSPTCTVWLGPQAHAVLYPLQGGTMLNLVFITTDSNFNNQCTKCDNCLQLVRTWFQDWDPVLREIVNLADSVGRFPLRELPELPFWKDRYVAIAGDAAHPIPPYLAQGAAIAVEDAHTLGTLFGSLAKKVDANPRSLQGYLRTQIPAHLSMYTEIRRRRVTRIMRLSQLNGKFNHLLDGEECAARDREFAAFDILKPCVSNCPLIDAKTNDELLGQATADDDEQYALSLSNMETHPVSNGS